MTRFNFKSQPCTSCEQSERLLALGLKPETADCYWRLQPYYNDEGFDCGLEWSCNMGTFLQDDAHKLFLDYIPAWSLGRLVEMMPDTIAVENATCMGHKFFYLLTFMYDFVTYQVNSFVFKEFAEHDNYYDNIIDCIEWLIKEGYFNKEYLEE